MSDARWEWLLRPERVGVSGLLAEEREVLAKLRAEAEAAERVVEAARPVLRVLTAAYERILSPADRVTGIWSTLREPVDAAVSALAAYDAARAKRGA